MSLLGAFSVATLESTNEFESSGTTYLIGTTQITGSMYVSGGTIYGTSSYSTDTIAKGAAGAVQYSSGYGPLLSSTDFVFNDGLLSLRHGNGNTANTGYTHAEGDGTSAINQTAHSEGQGTIAGAVGYIASDAGNTTPGDVFIDASYGDVSSYFIVGNVAVFTDTAYGNSYGIVYPTISDVVWNGTKVRLRFASPYDAISTAIGAEVYSVNTPSTTGNRLLGSGQHAEGNTTIAFGEYTHAEGYSTTAVAPYSHTEGESTRTYGNGSHAEGYNTIATGNYSHAEGNITRANGIASHAEGDTTIATGDYSHTEGQYTTSSGKWSHAEGYSSTTIGEASHAQGYNTIAYGNWSHAGGRYTIASGSYQTVVGQFNKHSNTTDLFVIGNGANTSNRSDIFNVSTTNITMSGSVNISGSLLVNGTTPGGSTVKAGSGSAASFGGSPRTGSITFASAFSNNSYSVTVTGEDARSWSIQSKTLSGFTINSNSSVALTGPVYWIATPFGS